MKTISRKDAKERGLKFYFTGNPCKNGHMSKRRVSNCGCIECVDDKRKYNRVAISKHSSQRGIPHELQHLIW